MASPFLSTTATTSTGSSSSSSSSSSSGVEYVIRSAHRAVVLEFGSRLIRVGFASEHCPRHLIPNPPLSHFADPTITPASKTPTTTTTTTPSTAASQQSDAVGPADLQLLFQRSARRSQTALLTGALVRFMQHVYVDLLLLNPRDRRVIVVEDRDTPEAFRNALAAALFSPQLDVPAVSFVQSHDATTLAVASFAPAAAAGKATEPGTARQPTPTAASVGGGPAATFLLVDCAHARTAILPIVHGVPVTAAYTTLPIGGAAVERQLALQLGKSFPSVQFTSQTIEDIKVRACYVRASREPATTNRTLVYSLQGAPESQPLVLQESLIGSPYDVLFADDPVDDGDEHEQSLVSSVLQALLESSVDDRAALAANILLVGGTSGAAGFLKRFAVELNHTVNNTPRFKSLLPLLTPTDTRPAFGVVDSVFPVNTIAWVGGSLLGSLNANDERFVTRETYQQTKSIPNWADVVIPEFSPEIAVTH
ncbi:hypothetical protein CAOG_03092 [Capsaspora owczarzaki ATCC 30864]|uniref:Uncharacterized protein n=1 Tax=Capsaspora owczarzaki (strain ATCC 30864) TaxID=595528 RepID=A0A0D2WMJ7_CAPO3|nr:hypothetical protein CAOG_03092 [Capsaspora owczarzaki ATCC 30864]KJE92065.1 hypothetical protein CAOG_003092 [Capsaspora owczarzaki ATCC 30864]|eukprot:XP_004363931.1 hypothetical protein CAOG_03092 [Capsaspora owczarzaki ATCC 30864]